MRVASLSQVQNLGLKLVLCEGIIALKTLIFSCTWRRIQKLYENLFFCRFSQKNVEFWSVLAKN